MTVHLTDLFPADVFEADVAGGYIRLQTHGALQIANYTEKAQYEGHWTPATLACRGLIYEPETGEIVARPFPKFFNYGDDEHTGPLNLDAPCIVTDKLDGSLGISYPGMGGPLIATRGSFGSDQAEHASHVLIERYPHFRPLPGWTYLFEIVYPENRIVVDYGDIDDLFLLAIVHNDTGRICRGEFGWPGPVAEAFPYKTLREALAAPPRAGQEGFVVRFTDNRMVKIKQPDYVALHRIVTGMNARTLWEWLGDGKTVGDICATVPDDFHGWIEDVAGELNSAANNLIHRARSEHYEITRRLNEKVIWTRGDYAREAAQVDKTLRPYLFLLLDDQEDRARRLAWRAVKPSGALSMVNHTEAVA